MTQTVHDPATMNGSPIRDLLFVLAGIGLVFLAMLVATIGSDRRRWR